VHTITTVLLGANDVRSRSTVATVFGRMNRIMRMPPNYAFVWAVASPIAS